MTHSLPIHIPIDEAQLRAFCERWHITALSLFGSVLRDDFRPDSDIDVLVTIEPAFAKTLSLMTLVGMANELEDMFGREVDLLERSWIEASHNPVRRKAILSTAQEVYRAAA